MKSIVRFSFLILLLLGCRREEVDFIGPAYISAPEGFAVNSFTGTPSPVDFTSATVSFNASFTHSVSWILTIQGQTSGAVIVKRGIGNGLNNVIWKGDHDHPIFFKAGETATATLSFYGTTLTTSVDITITDVPDFTVCGTYPSDGNFENPVAINFPYWARFNIAEQDVGSDEIDYNGNVVPPVEGNNYYFMRGLGDQAVFVDGIQYIGPFFPTLPANPKEVWVNFYAYGTGDANGLINIEYQEADFDGESPGYLGTDDDAFVAQIPLDHKGWKLFSFRYSDLLPTVNAEFGGSGNKIHEPHNLKSFNIVLLKKSSPNSPVEAYFDFPIITVGGPFKPCN